MSLIHPGEVSDPEPLADILKNVHEDRRTAILNDIKRRKENGAPLDDDTRWPKVIHHVKVAETYAIARETAKLRDQIFETLGALATPVQDPGAYQADPRAAHISIAMKVLSAREVRKLGAAETRAIDRRDRAKEEFSRAKKAGDELAIDAAHKTIEEADEAVVAARRAYVSAVVVKMLDGDAPIEIGDASIDTLERSGLLMQVVQACTAFQELPWGKGERSGSRARATLSNSNAAPVPTQPAPAAGATADP